MAIDEATAGFLAQLAETGMKPLHEMTPQEARDQLGPHLGAGGSNAGSSDS